MLDQLIQDLTEENALGLLLLAQLGQTPSELTVAARTVTLDQTTGQLHPIGSYVVRLGGLIEHTLTLGPFDHAATLEDHPLLYHHNAPGVQLFITGPAQDANGVVAQLAAAHQEMFGRYRQLGEDLNKRAEPNNVLSKGMGLLGTFPEPFAAAAGQVLTANGVTYSMLPGEGKIGGYKLLAFDNSFFIARMIEVQVMQDG